MINSLAESPPPYPWQQEQWRSFAALHDQQRMPHAILLEGMRGIGKQAFAKQMAAALLCRSVDTHKPCNQCKSCLLLKSDTHPDYLLIEPESEGKAIKIDQVRELAQFLAQTAQQGGFKTVIVSPAENMNLNATNALLKSLEEPQGDSLIILVTAHASRLLATVRSRCLKMGMGVPEKTMATRWLHDRVGAQAEELLSLCHGAPLAALDAFTNDLVGVATLVKTINQSVLRGELGVPEAAKQLAEMDHHYVIEVLLQWISDLISQSFIGGSDVESLLGQGQPTRQSAERLFQVRDRVMSTKRLLLSPTNPNAQLLWEEHLMDWLALLKS